MRYLDDVEILNTINLTLHVLLLLFLVCILLISLVDGYWRTKQSYKYFLLSIVVSILQCCQVTIYLTTHLIDVDMFYVKCFYAIASVLLPVTYIPRIMVVISTIEEKHPIRYWIKVFVNIVPMIAAVFCLAFIVNYQGDFINLFYDFHNEPFLQAIYLFSFSFAIFGVYVIIRYRNYLEGKIFRNYLVFLLVPTISSFITKWHFALFNLTSLYVFFIMYIGTWQQKKYEIAEQEKKIAEIDAQLSASRTEVMLSQIQPHFLYNVLSSIAALCEINPKLAQQVTTNFADYLRANLQSLTEKAPIPFERELKHTMLYVDIEKVRFEEKLNVTYDIQTKNFSIPSLTLQPIVENAIKHGVTKKEGGGSVKISTYEDTNNYYVKVEDDGIGFDINKINDDERLHLGIITVEYRVRTMSKGSIRVESTPNVGTIVTIEISK